MKPEEIIINQLFEQFKKNGYITENDIFELCETYDISFLKTDYVGNQLLAKGVLISDGLPQEEESEQENTERGPSERVLNKYEEIYRELVLECPGLASIVEYARQTPPPKMKEVRELFKHIRSGNRHAKDILVQKHIRVALNFAISYQNKTSVPIEDIFSECMIGIIKAVDSYDPFSGYRRTFSRYATHWMEQLLDRYILGTDRTIRYSSAVNVKIHKVKNMDMQFREFCDNNVYKSIMYISEVFELSYEEAEWYYYQAIDPYDISIEEIIENEELYGSPYLTYSIEKNVEDPIIKTIIRQALYQLPDRERAVIGLRYGLFNGKEYTLEEVGKKFNLSRARIQQIESKALRKLKTPKLKNLLYTFD